MSKNKDKMLSLAVSVLGLIITLIIIWLIGLAWW
jgi:hypothetical protein